MNFACLTDKSALYFFPLNEPESAYLAIQVERGARYIFTEREGVDFSEAVVAERVKDDLYLRLRSTSEAPSTLVLQDFYQASASIHGLSDTGEYRLHLISDSLAAQGPVIWNTKSLGLQQDQAEAASLKIVQQAATLQAFETLAESLNPVVSAVPESIEGAVDAESVSLVAAESRSLDSGALPESTIDAEETGPVTFMAVGAD